MHKFESLACHYLKQRYKFRLVKWVQISIKGNLNKQYNGFSDESTKQ